jgi:alpha-L-fucosidase
LSVPVCPDGTIDADEQAIVSDIGAWLKVNGEAIYATRPWKIYGEGPAMSRQEKGEFGGQKDVSSEPFTSEDIRFTQSKDGKSMYAIVLGIPTGTIKIKSLAGQKISQVTLLGSSEKIDWRMEANALVIQPVKHWPAEYAVSFKLN